uniref:Uncharacterized protein n=1 Tax=Anguilla anguilla TaxID=7936 RepID=A0A0E9PPU3_ANGAN
MNTYWCDMSVIIKGLQVYIIMPFLLLFNTKTALFQCNHIKALGCISFYSSRLHCWSY